MEAKIVIACPSCADAPPPGFTTVTICANCSKMIWLNRDLVKKKNETKSPCWCIPCVKKMGNDPDIKIKALKWDEFCKIKDKATKIGDDLWDVDVDDLSDEKRGEMLEEFFFKHAEAINSEMLKNLEGILPAMCSAYMSKLKVYDDVADLGIACSLAAYVEKILLDKRDKQGSGFEGYTSEQKTRILLFVIGVRDAVDAFIEENGNDPHKMASLLDIVQFGNFTKGIEYWTSHMKKRHNHRS
jgi:hypothetical protein